MKAMRAGQSTTSAYEFRRLATLQRKHTCQPLCLGYMLTNRFLATRARCILVPISRQVLRGTNIKYNDKSSRIPYLIFHWNFFTVEYLGNNISEHFFWQFLNPIFILNNSDYLITYHSLNLDLWNFTNLCLESM